MNLKCPLCCAEQECLHKGKEFDMSTVWEQIVEFGYPSFPAYEFNEEVARHRLRIQKQGRKII
jgi:hypothetical protein